MNYFLSRHRLYIYKLAPGDKHYSFTYKDMKGEWVPWNRDYEYVSDRLIRISKMEALKFVVDNRYPQSIIKEILSALMDEL